MKIGIDVGCLAIEKESQKSGLYRLAVNFLKTASILDKKNDYCLFSFAPIEKRLLTRLGPNFKNIVARPAFGWLYFGLPFHLLLSRVNVFLSLSQSLPLASFCPKAVVFHDLAFEKLPHLYSKKEEKRLKRVSRSAAARADLIFAVSKAAKSDLSGLYRVKQKIVVVHEAAGEEFKPQPAGRIKRVRQKYCLKKDYFLFVGSLKPSKNLDNIVKAFGLLKNKKLQLVLVGAGSLTFKNKRIKKLGFVEDKDLPALYSGALGLVAPSCYEGFGLPWVEAMACGCPVIAGNTGSGPEVVGKAGFLVNPADVKSIAAKIKKLTNKQIRNKFFKAGLKQAEKFSWQKFTGLILKELEKIAGQ